jgi:hypothetical protein
MHYVCEGVLDVIFEDKIRLFDAIFVQSLPVRRVVEQLWYECFEFQLVSKRPISRKVSELPDVCIWRRLQSLPVLDVVVC